MIIPWLATFAGSFLGAKTKLKGSKQQGGFLGFAAGIMIAASVILLSVAAGAMVFIVVEELIPASQAINDGHSATYGFLLGFWIMAVMGIART